MNYYNLSMKTMLLLCTSLSISACTTIAERTNVLSDEDIRSKTAGTLGYPANSIIIVNRRVDGVNTFVVVRGADKKEFACTINGGNLLSMGMTNPPTCTPKR